MSALELFEEQHKRGATHVSQWHATVEKQKADPSSLTEFDLAVLDHFGGSKAAEAARSARAAAQPQPPPPPAPAPLRATIGKASMDQIAAAIVGAIKRAMQPRDAQIQELKQQIVDLRQSLATLEAKSMSFEGTWQAEATYGTGDLVRRSGSLWICKLNYCKAVPGQDGGTGWELCLKRGDAR